MENRQQATPVRRDAFRGRGSQERRNVTPGQQSTLYIFGSASDSVGAHKGIPPSLSLIYISCHVVAQHKQRARLMSRGGQDTTLGRRPIYRGAAIRERTQQRRQPRPFSASGQKRFSVGLSDCSALTPCAWEKQNCMILPMRAQIFFHHSEGCRISLRNRSKLLTSVLLFRRIKT